MIKKLLSCYKPSGWISSVLFLLASPLLFFVFPFFLTKLLPDFLYYTPLTFYSGFVEFTPLYIIIPLLAWPIFMTLGRLVKRIRSLAGRVVTTLLLIIVPVAGMAAPFYLSPDNLAPLIFVNAVTNNRFALGHPMCSDPLLDYVDRCEGRNRGLMQARMSAVALYGTPVPDIDKAIKALPKYKLAPVSCSDLVGGGVGRCFAGYYAANTGDTYYLNVYVYDAKGKALVLKSTNVRIVSNQLITQWRNMATSSGEKLEEFLDINRFNPAE